MLGGPDHSRKAMKLIAYVTASSPWGEAAVAGYQTARFGSLRGFISSMSKTNRLSPAVLL